jgi:phosphoglycolate phosphatase-like HAD superfamily hydrolase
VTASDHLSRVEIVAAAVDRAGHGRAVSVGDGLWDAEAAAALGLPFVGIGPDPDRYRGTAVRVDPDLAVLGCADLVALAGGAS